MSDSQRRRSWLLWARDLEGMAPADTAVVMELAHLADWRGESVVSVAHLVDRTHLGVRTVKRVLARLEARGVLLRRRRRVDGHQGASLIRLLPQAVGAAAEDDVEEIRVYRFPLPEVDLEGRWVETSDNEGLREAILGAIDESWRGEEMGVVYRSLDRAVDHQLAGIVYEGIEFARLRPDESKADTTSWAWQVVRECTERIVTADCPWAMWTVITKRATRSGRDDVLLDGVKVEDVDPSLMPEGVSLPGEMTVDAVAVDDFERVLRDPVDALVAAGMDETTAWAGTRRVAELAVLKGSSRRHTAAAEDARLEDLGVSAPCARAWMTLLVGSRRGTRGSVLEMARGVVVGMADMVVTAYPDIYAVTSDTFSGWGPTWHPALLLAWSTFSGVGECVVEGGDEGVGVGVLGVGVPGAVGGGLEAVPEGEVGCGFGWSWHVSELFGHG